MKTRILYFHAESSLGGAGRNLLLLLQHLPPYYQPLVVLPGPGKFASLLKAQGIPFQFERLRRFPSVTDSFFHQKNQPKVWARVLKDIAFLPAFTILQEAMLRRLIQLSQPDIIHINSATLIAEGRAASREKIAVVWHIRDILSNKWMGRWAGTMIPRWSDAVIAVSSAVAQRLKPRDNNVKVIYDGVNLEDYSRNFSFSRSKIREAQGVPYDAPCIGFVGRVTRAKGIFDLIEAAPMILGRVPETHFLIVGNMPNAQDEDPRQAIQRLGLEERFHIAGEQSNVQDFIAAMDVVALPSRSEGFGNTVIEAMSMGKPVVTSNITALPELVTHGESGLLVQPGNPEQLAKACIRFIEDKELASSCGKQAAARVRRNFSIESTVTVMDELYQSLLERNLL